MDHPATNTDYTRLSASERLLLAQDIIDSVIADTTELGRRCRSVDDGNVTSIRWDDICQLFVSR